VPKPVVEGVWIVDSGPLRIMGAPLPVRMTVIRLSNGDLWLHSPTRYDDSLRAELERNGRIRHLVAPDIAHWTFMQDWQQRCPDAVTWAAPGLRDRAQVKKSGVRFDRDLGPAPPPEWADDMEQAVVPGMGFAEVAFFHKPSRTLILTDLVQNLEPEKLPMLMRQVARLTGILAPDGGTPIYLRMILRAKRRAAATAVTRMLAWNPERVVFSHGRWFDQGAAAALRRSFSWLVG
jgi:hypothetical protein